MVVANTSIHSDTSQADESAGWTAWRGSTIFANRMDPGEGTRSERSLPLTFSLVDYAGFVLDQEAKYCQQ